MLFIKIIYHGIVYRRKIYKKVRDVFLSAKDIAQYPFLFFTYLYYLKKMDCEGILNFTLLFPIQLNTLNTL